MEKKEFHRHYLPHFQQPGQAYFVTWSLKDAVPPKALHTYSQKLELLKSQINSLGPANSYSSIITQSNIEANAIPSHKPAPKTPTTNSADPLTPVMEELLKEYDAVRRKYIKSYDNLLDAERRPTINLSKPDNRAVMMASLKFWEGKKLNNCAYTIMSNHVHWVFELLEKDQEGHPVYLQDILQSVKGYSAYRINKLENRKGNLWQKESYDTTIRDEQHLYNAINYTLNNPVKAGLTTHWKLWPGSWYRSDDF